MLRLHNSSLSSLHHALLGAGAGVAFDRLLILQHNLCRRLASCWRGATQPSANWAGTARVALDELWALALPAITCLEESTRKV